MCLLATGSLDERAELIFKLYDFNRSDSISKDELTILLTNALTSINNMLGIAKPDILLIEELTADFFEKGDTN